MNNAHANLLVSQLLSKNPGLRLGGSYSNLKNHSFFNNFAWVIQLLILAWVEWQKDKSSLQASKIKANWLVKDKKVIAKANINIFEKLWEATYPKKELGWKMGSIILR